MQFLLHASGVLTAIGHAVLKLVTADNRYEQEHLYADLLVRVQKPRRELVTQHLVQLLVNACGVLGANCQPVLKLVAPEYRNEQEQKIADGFRVQCMSLEVVIQNLVQNRLLWWRLKHRIWTICMNWT